MCGVAALSVAPSRAVAAGDAVRRMVAALRHRGPDGEGATCAAAVPAETWLGHARLAILDPSPAAAQPMRHPSGHWIAFHGGIYNHRALREEMGAPEGGWRSTSDAETVLHAYAVWDRECLSRLRGVFAFVLWDERRRRLWCVRDRLGIKPLYYAEGPDGVAVASEVRALEAAGWASDAVEPAALASYLRWGCPWEPTALRAGVRSVPAGHALTVSDGRMQRLDRWWWGLDGVGHRPTTGTRGGALRERLRRTVLEHLASDVPLGLFLSGGIDSCVLAGLAAEVSGPGVAALTLGWSDADGDETARAVLAAKKHRLAHRVVRLDDEEAAAQVPQAVASLDLPTLDGLHTWLVARAAARAGFRVVLSDLGGDELFGGNPTSRRLARATRWAAVGGRVPTFLLAAVLGRARAERAHEMLAPSATLADRYRAARAVWSASALRRAGALANGEERTEDPDPALPFGTRVSLLEAQGYLRSMRLRDADQAGMAHSVEIRAPFLDHEIVEAALAGDGPGLDGKVHLLAAARDLVPSEVSEDPKVGFVLPMDRWMRGPLASYVDDGVRHAVDLGLVRRDFAEEASRAFRRGRLSWNRPWQLAVLGHWGRARGAVPVA
jgi:asparagine synthase (glutamine-hydrolysing)